MSRRASVFLTKRRRSLERNPPGDNHAVVANCLPDPCRHRRKPRRDVQSWCQHHSDCDGGLGVWIGDYLWQPGFVRDIVSGIFYLADDAFRVGEYIDCGSAKETVAGFIRRSMRLRHQNGQVQTIPFGQLGQITNFSRDWTTQKFNLRLARYGSRKLRKTTKKSGSP
jgi:hypothetical protein